LRNWASYADEVILAADIEEWQRHLLTDPQTSGGLLIACDPDYAAELVQKIAAAGFPRACMIGATDAGAPFVTVG
jgi:selenide,water dikinase